MARISTSAWRGCTPCGARCLDKQQCKALKKIICLDNFLITALYGKNQIKSTYRDQGTVSIDFSVKVHCVHQGHMWLNILKWTSWVRSSKLTFFLNSYSFSSILVQHFFDIRHCVWECDHSTDNFITDLWKVDFQKFENLATLIAEIAIQKSIFTWKCCFYTSNPQSNLEIKYWRFQHMWNLKLDHVIIFWDILTLHLKNQVFWLVLFDMLSHIIVNA